MTYPTNGEGKIEGKVGRSGTVKSYWPGLLVAREGGHISTTRGHGAGKLYISGTGLAFELLRKDYRTQRETGSQRNNNCQQGLPNWIYGPEAKEREKTESQELEKRKQPGVEVKETRDADSRVAT